jgi:hypothetical protein
VSNEFYRRLVDLYASRELPAELEDQMDLAAFQDPELSHDMATLRRLVDALQSQKGAEFTEESYQRILMKLYAHAGAIEETHLSPVHMQYHLPMRLN